MKQGTDLSEWRAAFFLFLSTFVLIAGPLHAQTAIDSLRRAEIITLMRVTGAGDISARMLDSIVGAYKATTPTVPEKFWQDFRAGVNQDGLLDLCIPIYDQALTDKELQGMIKFFESSIGKKFIDISPYITEQTMLKGQAWGQQIGLQIAQKLEEQGYGKAKPESIKTKSPTAPTSPLPPVPPSSSNKK